MQSLAIDKFMKRGNIMFGKKKKRYSNVVKQRYHNQVKVYLSYYGFEIIQRIYNGSLNAHELTEQGVRNSAAFKDSLLDLKLAIRGFGNFFVEYLAPIFTWVINHVIIPFIVYMRKLYEVIVNVIRGLAQLIGDVFRPLISCSETTHNSAKTAAFSVRFPAAISWAEPSSYSGRSAAAQDWSIRQLLSISPPEITERQRSR